MADTGSRRGSGYATSAILDWVAGVHAPHDHGLEIAFRAPEEEGLPAIQVGPSEGRLLALLLRLVGARRVVEIGTLAGYSALWMARAVGPGGQVLSIEIDPRTAQIARENIAQADMEDRITVLEGAALEVLPQIAAKAPFDAVFVDADKGNYDRYGRWAADHVRPGGLLIADNAFLFGRLLDDGEEAQAMRRFHEEAARAFDTVCIPTPDGLLVGPRSPVQSENT
jgi:caffeoyl-CoA O-methyltransferase